MIHAFGRTRCGSAQLRLCCRNVTTQREVRNKLLQRILLNNTNEHSKDSSWKLWWSHLKGSSQYTKLQLSYYQKLLMTRSVEPSIRVTNSVTSNGINQWHFHNSNTEQKIPILLIHGYASSSVSFFRNIRGLSAHYSDVYAIDLPGNGLSQELKFYGNLNTGKLFIEWATDKNLNQYKLVKIYNPRLAQSCIIDSINYYIDSMEEWRKINKIDKFQLIGHSFGGYMAYQYAKKYPNVVDKLCLVSPLGMERNIYSLNNNFEFWDVDNVLDINIKDPTSIYYTRNFHIPKYLFISQFKILRQMGPLGARICYNYINNAYSRVPSDDFKRYMFTLFYGKDGITNTAVNIFNNLFTRNLLARDPIMDTIADLPIDNISFLYGKYDWMNKEAGRMTRDRLNARRKTNKCHYFEIPNAGHNLFLDNPTDFDESIISCLDA